MTSIFFKEIHTFFSSLIGYMAIGVFLIILGLSLWVIPSTSILDFSYATLEPLFTLAPFIFAFLVPALTMRMFSEEIQLGTIELLSTKPISSWGILLGKYFAALVILFLALLPTAIYYFSVHQLGSPVGNIDSGAVLGSYIGLFLLGAAFTAIGLFASSVTQAQILAFIIGAALCLFFFFAFDALSTLPVFAANIDSYLQMLGIDYHYESISRGLIDTRDLVYFLSLIVLFLYFTYVGLERRKW